MTSSDGNIFRVTGSLWEEPPVIGGFVSQRPVRRSFDVFIAAHEQTAEQKSRRRCLRRHGAHYNVLYCNGISTDPHNCIWLQNTIAALCWIIQKNWYKQTVARFNIDWDDLSPGLHWVLKRACHFVICQAVRLNFTAIWKHSTSIWCLRDFEGSYDKAFIAYWNGP